MTFKTIVAFALLIGLASPVLAQSNIDETQKMSWSESAGWLNWRDANGTLSGVRVHSGFLSGFIWAENTGWINLGDGTPEAGTQYSNDFGSDAGVNVGDDGTLFGLGWGENVGWINFGTSMLGSDRARLDLVENRFRGYAWGENAGWINLDDDTHFVGTESVGTPYMRGDCDGNGALDIVDPINALAVLFTGGSTGCFDACNVNGDGIFDIVDPIAMLSFLFENGPSPAAPFPGCGISPLLGCDSYSACP